MNYLVTGNLGFLGSNLAREIYNSGSNVVGIDDHSFGTKENTCGDFYTQTLGCFTTLTEEYLTRFDCIIHCATHNIIAAQHNPIETVYTNAYKTIDFFRRYNGKIINISTSSVYGDAKDIPTKETDEISCTEPYSMSKRIVEMYLEQRGNFTTIRPANFFGINQRPSSPYAGVLGKFIQCAIDEKPMTIYGDGTHTRSYLYVDDVVDAIIKAVKLPAQNTEINIGSSEEISSLDLCKLIWKIVDLPVRYTIEKPRKIDTITRRALDCTRAKELLNWEATTPLEQGIEKTIFWQQSL